MWAWPLVSSPSLSAATARGRMPRRAIQLRPRARAARSGHRPAGAGRLGLTPWVVLHQGLALRLDISLGTATIGVGLLMLLAWIPLRERPGLGTVANVLLVGAGRRRDARPRPLDRGARSADRARRRRGGADLARASPPTSASGSGQARGTGHDRARTAHRLVDPAGPHVDGGRSWCSTGFLLGGTVGSATLLVVLTIGPLTQFFVRYLVIRLPSDTSPVPVITATP